ncbi:hypothetical protein [Flavobacterium gilvum]|uniref:Integrase catalytic domain-containing protein n=1 Tax=Flavobacterium gilvum TaxID=1492737 RepID=A0AAC9N517_9FLAO|nr:hypothetical protein [Flavobacterium gilvum]AOW08712.1 hypothetical protein EM308_03920 [Flavobacterium gilvum]KFC59850.1 hypothetical protein FEM08_13610 [Flavobacterium gilvum]
METPYKYYEKKLGFKIKYLIYDRDYHVDSLKLISYRAINWRMNSDTCIEKQLRRGSLGCDALVVFDSLSQDWKDRITTKFGKPKEEVKKSWFAQHYVADREAFDFYIGYRYGEKNSKKLELDTIEQYGYNASVLNTVLIMKNNRKQYLKALGYTSVDIWDSLSRDVNAFRDVDHNLPTTKDSLRYKVNKYVKEGYAGLISGKFGMQNALKIKEREQEALLDELLAKHTNLDNTLIATVYNAIAEQKNWPTITAQTVGNRKEKSNLVIYAGRNGVSALSNNILMQNKRQAPTSPMLYWTLDGWDAELLYQKSTIDKKGYSVTTYHNRLTMVVVLDPFNKYPVGYAIGTHETPELIKEALRNAFNHTAELFGQRFKPYQLQSDNYQKKALTPVYEACTKYYTPAAVKNAKAKVIEPYFAHINKTYCKLMDNWSGFGVGSGSKNQPNSEMLAKLSRSFPDEIGCRKQLESIIAAERSKKQKQYLEQWENTQETHRLPMPTENYLLALGKTTGDTNKLEGSGLHIKINGVKRTYDCFELDFRQQAHQNWNILYDDNNLNEVLAISADQKYRFVLQDKYIQSMAIAEHNEDDGWQRQRVKEYNNTAIKFITDTREDNANVLDQFFNQNPLLNDTLAKHLLTDSRGQHKDNKSQQRLQPEAEKVLLKQERTIQKAAEKSWQDEQNEYHNNKIDLNNYI